MLAISTFGGIGCASNPRNTSPPERDRFALNRDGHGPRHHLARHAPATPADSSLTTPAPGAATVLQEPAPARPPEIRVLGEVEKPGAIPFQKGADLAFYVTRAGGPTRNSEIRKVQIIRGKPGSRVASEYAVGGPNPHALPSVHDGDIVIVHTEADKAPAQASGSLPVKAAATFLGTMALLIIAI